MKHAIVHVADIHYRPNEPEGVSTVLQAFVSDLQNQRNIIAADRYYIAITGDLVFAGNDSQAYSALYEEFDDALSKVGFAKDVRVVVPGNHDMDQSTVKHDAGAPGKAWCFLQGESPCRVRFSQPSVPSVA